MSCAPADTASGQSRRIPVKLKGCLPIKDKSPTRHARLTGCVASILALLCAEAVAASRTVALTGDNTRIALTVYAFGLFALPGSYTDFQGSIAFDPGDAAACQVAVTIVQSSLHMADPARTRRALAPDMLDAQRFPTMHFEGKCDGPTATGILTLHGVSRPLSLALTRDGTHVSGDGRLIRRDFGITGMPHLLGQTIRIRFSATLPGT